MHQLKLCSVQIYIFCITTECNYTGVYYDVLIYLAGPFVSSILSSMAVIVVWKVLRAKNRHDLLRDFR